VRRLRERLVQLREEAGGSGTAEELAKRRKDPGRDLTRGEGEGYLRSFLRNAASDLNMPRCLADLWALLKDDAVSARARIEILYEMDRILGLGLAEWEPGATELSTEEQRLVDERNRARVEKDYEKADRIRNILRKRGIILEDRADGSRYRRK
jgi:cysteinyl-tRNA synthetase